MPRKDQAAANAQFETIAAVIAALPPAAEELWWNNANLTWREFLAHEFAVRLAAESAAKGLLFSRSRFVRACTPEIKENFDVLTLLRKGYELIMGMWAPAGTDPYAHPPLTDDTSLSSVIFSPVFAGATARSFRHGR